VYECERPRRRVAQLDREIDELDQELHTITTQLLPELLAECGVGPICADQLVVSSGDPTRMTSEASFAALARHQPRTSICVIRQLARYFYRQLQTIPTLDLTP